MILRKVEQLDNPPTCFGCGRGNTPDEHGEVGPFLATALDAHWGDDVQFCDDCITKIAVFWGFTTPQEHEENVRDLKKAHAAAHELKADRDKWRMKYQSLSKGIKLVKAGVPKSTRSKEPSRSKSSERRHVA